MSRTIPAPRGRLIALDGGVAPLTAAVTQVMRALASARIPRGVSAWDGSGIFTELAARSADVQGPSARTLTLLYAADLTFRLRWQILPAIEEGRSVVAAPYVDTAKALGIAAGLPRTWLDELFRFAPKADASYSVAGRIARTASAGTRGYGEFFSETLLNGDAPIDPADLQTRALAYLVSLERRRRCTRLTAGALRRVTG